MNYTAREIKEAKRLKELGFNWIAREKGSYLPLRVYVDKPKKLKTGWKTLSEWGWIVYYDFQSVTWEDEEPTSLDDIIASEKPKYDRLTDRDIAVTLNINYSEDTTRLFKYAQRLWKLENKIESGEFVFREVEE